MRQLLLCLTLAVLAISSPLSFGQNSDLAVRKAVEDFLHVQLKGLPGKSSFTIDSIQTSALPACSTFDVSITPGARAWGRSSVSVRCVSGANWSVLVPVKIQAMGNYLVSARPLTSGQVIDPLDISIQTGDLGELPTGILSDPSQAVGKISRVALPAGRPLRSDMIKAPTVIQQGQSVKVISRGAGFEVSNEGRALNNAVGGQVVQVRLASGQVVSGVATADGSVEISR